MSSPVKVTPNDPCPCGSGRKYKRCCYAKGRLDMAQARWRQLDGADLPPLVRGSVVFVDGVQPEGKANRTRARAA